jgi:NAD(P)H-flavin reductase
MTTFQRPQRVRFKVSQKQEFGFNIVKLRFEADIQLNFDPGQFVTLFIDERTRRSYSISSVPGTNYFETYNDTTPGGPGSLFFKNARIGDEIIGMIPLGRFVYKEHTNPAVFIATGTGITPMKSMLDYALSNGSKRDLQLIWGVKSDEELFLASEFNKLADLYNNLKIQYCITRQEDSKYFKGRVTSYIDQLEFIDNSEFYICGSKNMISEVEQILLLKGFPIEVIKYEQFY